MEGRGVSFNLTTVPSGELLVGLLLLQSPTGVRSVCFEVGHDYRRRVVLTRYDVRGHIEGIASSFSSTIIDQ